LEGTKNGVWKSKAFEAWACAAASPVSHQQTKSHGELLNWSRPGDLEWRFPKLPVASFALPDCRQTIQNPDIRVERTA